MNFHRGSFVPILTECSRFFISDGRAATLVDLVLRTGTKLTSLVPDIILGMVLDLTKRYSSPGCLLLFLNVPHNIFAIRSRLIRKKAPPKSRQIPAGVINARYIECRRPSWLPSDRSHSRKLFFKNPKSKSRLRETLGNKRALADIFITILFLRGKKKKRIYSLSRARFLLSTRRDSCIHLTFRRPSG